MYWAFSLLFDNTVKTGNNIDSGLFRHNFGLNLVTHRNDRLVRGSNEGDSVLLKLGSKIGVFGKKAISRMDSLSSCLL